jgi:hypothetical protein
METSKVNLVNSVNSNTDNKLIVINEEFKNQNPYTEDLKIDERFERLTPVCDEEMKALENLILSDGEIQTPIVIWQGENIVVDGHSRLNILKNHPDLPYSIKEIPFEDWRAVMAWIVEHHIARKSFTLWQKLEMAYTCVDYWEAKEKAQRNKGARNDLNTPGVHKSKPINTKEILANKVGCGTTTVSQFLKVFKEASESTKQRCREGDMSIKRAHESLQTKKAPSKNNQEKPETEIKVEDIDILEECENNQPVTDNSLVSIPNPNPIAQQMQKEDVPDETMWIALDIVENTMQIFMKKLDSDKNIENIHVNSFSFKRIAPINNKQMLEVQRIGNSTEVLNIKSSEQLSVGNEDTIKSVN